MENSEIERAAKILRDGGIVIFPTDTVWGIGASIDRLDAIKRLYRIKKREKSKPTAVLVGDITVANQLGVIGRQTQLLIDEYWPGDLTIIVKARSGVPREILGNSGNIGIRQPAHPLALDLLKKLGSCLVTASANFSGQPTPDFRRLVDQLLIDQADLFMFGECGNRPASTVLDTTVRPFKIIRQGKASIKL